MATFTVADAAVAIGADFKTYDAALGKKATETRGKLAKLGQAVKNDFGMVFGAVAGGLGAAGLKVGESWDSAFDTIRTSTGKTGEALQGLQGDLQAMAGTVEDSIGTQAQVLADLNKRTGQTGKSLQDLTKTELDLARITGTDVNRNVEASTRLFGDWSIATADQGKTLDAMYRASTATGIGVDVLMEKVVQFGAPLRAMGFGLDESAALLGKWEKEGVNSELVLGSLRIAMGKFAKDGVPARKGLEDTIAKIKALGPGAEATSLAMETFGARAGADMAAAILEGRFELGNLLDQVENGGDTIAQATSDTEDFGAAWAKFANGVSAKIGPLLAGFGDVASTVGPLLYMFPALGGVIGKFFGGLSSKGVGAIKGALETLYLKGLMLGDVFKSNKFVKSISDGLGSALGKIPGSSKFAGATDKLGQFMGTKLGKGLSVAFAAVAIFEVIQTYNEIKAGLDEQSAQIGKDVGTQIVAGTTESLNQSKAALEQGIKDLNDLWYNPFAGDQKNQLQAQLDATNAELQKRAAMSPDAIAAKLKEGQKTVDAAAADLVDGIPDATSDAATQAGAAAAKTPGEIADGIRSRRDAAAQAMADLVDGIKNAMTPAKERARVIGYLTSDELAKALKSKDPALRAQAEASRDLWLSQLAELPVGANGLGKKAMDALNKALHDKNPAVRAEAARVKGIIEDQIRAAKTKEAAKTAMANVTTGIKTGSGPVGPAAWNVGRKIVNQMLAGISGPVKLAKAGQAPKAYATGTMNVPADMFAMVHQGEIIIPRETSDAIRAGDATFGHGLPAGAGGGGDTFNITVPITGVLAARTPDDVARPMRQLAASGHITSRRDRERMAVPNG